MWEEPGHRAFLVKPEARGWQGRRPPLCLAVSVPRDGLFFLSPSITSWILQISFWICRLSTSFCNSHRAGQRK